MTTTVVYRGNFQPDQAEPWSTESQIAATLESMGCRVVRVQEVDTPPVNAAVGWEETTHIVGRERPDLFLWTTTTEHDPDAAYWGLEEIASWDVPRVGYHLDLWWGLSKREGQLLRHPFFHGLDYLFTADGGHQVDFHRIGVNHHWAEPAAFSARASANPKTDGGWPVIFLGSVVYPHPEHAEARKELVAWMHQCFPKQFRVVSGRNDAYTALIASATVVVGDSCLAGRIPYYWSERVPETLSRAGCLVHPYVPGIEDSYTDGEHLRLFEAGDLAQVRGIVEHLLAHPDVAADIGTRGQHRVLERHLFEHRLAEMFRIVGVKGPESYERNMSLQGDAGFSGA